MKPLRSPVATTLGVVAAGALAWSVCVEPKLLTLRRHTLPVLSAGMPSLRTLHLSDLHLAPWQTRKMNWVRSLVTLQPELIVLTGDMMGHVAARQALIHSLQPLAETGAPIVFVHGSNDYYGPVLKNPVKYLAKPTRLATRTPDIDNTALTRSLENLGCINLNNSATRITLRGTTLEIMGLGDPHIRYDDVSLMRAALHNLPKPAAEPPNMPLRIGVVHAPYQESLGELLQEGCDLIFAGHTHGGQLRLPGVGALTSNCDLPPAQARGLSVWFNAHRAAFLNVSAGLGNSIYAPVRFACRPEASLITLEARYER